MSDTERVKERIKGLAAELGIDIDCDKAMQYRGQFERMSKDANSKADQLIKSYIDFCEEAEVDINVAVVCLFTEVLGFVKALAEYNDFDNKHTNKIVDLGGDVIGEIIKGFNSKRGSVVCG